MFCFCFVFSSSSGNEGNIFQIDEETGNITMTKAADIVGPIILTVLVKKESNSSFVLWWFVYFLWRYFLLGSPGVAGDQPRSVRRDAGDLWGDEEEPEPSSLWEGALRRLHLQQLCPWEHDPPRPEHLPALQGPSPRRGLRRRKSFICKMINSRFEAQGGVSVFAVPRLHL